MDNVKHTPEPWRIGKSAYRYVDGVGIVASIYAPDGSGILAFVFKKEGVEYNARRIVACVNACAGFNTKTLELLNDIEHVLGQRSEKLEKALMQAAELSEENERLRTALESIANHYDQDGYSEDAWRELALEMAGVARTAIKNNTP